MTAVNAAPGSLSFGARKLSRKHDIAAKQPAASESPDPTEIAKYVLAMPLGTSATTIADLVLRAFGPLDNPTLQKVVRALDHAKLKMELIDEVTKMIETHHPK
jgi:hypothetical protein